MTTFGTRQRLVRCHFSLASPAVIAALLLLSICTAASTGLPRSAGGAGPSPHSPSQGAKAGSISGGGDRRRRNRPPPTSTRRPVPTTPSDDGGSKIRRNASMPTAPQPSLPTTTHGASSDAGVARARATAAAVATGRRRPPPERRQQQQPERPATAERVPEEQIAGEENSGLEVDLDFDDGDDDEGSGFDSAESDFGRWSDEGSSDDDGWSDEEEEDGAESDWGRGAAGGSGGAGGRSWRAEREKAGGGRGAGAGGRGERGGRGGGRGRGGGGSKGINMSSMRSRLNLARQRASRAYREAKSLMSSEMEGVVLKATRPDDLPVKPKHLEALMRPTTEMPKEFNVYLPVVRKLWSKMADREWRVSAKALYIVHRFAADGSIEHASNLRESVAVLRTHHDSRRKVNYFDMDTICDVKAPSWSGEDVAPMAEFLRGYADFVLRRTTQFGPGFMELLDAFTMLAGEGEMIPPVEELVVSGLGCSRLREDQEGALAVAAALQVAQDVRDVVEVCAAQLDYLVREWQARSVYPAEVDRWYAFLYKNREPVEALIVRANDLAERHKLSALRPLAATPVVLKLRDEEVALEKQARQAAPEREEQQCSSVEQEEAEAGEEEEEEEEEERHWEPPSRVEQAGTGGLKAATRKRGPRRDSGGDGGGGGRSDGDGEAQGVTDRRQGARRRTEQARPSASGAGSARPPSARGPPPGGLTGGEAGAAAAAAAAAAAKGAERAVGGGGGVSVKSGAPKKRRSSSPTNSKALGEEAREEGRARQSSTKGGVERGADVGVSRIGSDSRPGQQHRLKKDSAGRKKKRKKSPSSSEKPSHSR